MTALRELETSGWVSSSGTRIEMPAARRALLGALVRSSPAAVLAAKRWLVDYLRARLDIVDDWTEDERLNVAASLDDPERSMRLSEHDFCRALEIVRHTPDAPIAIRALRRRIAASGANTLRRALGGLLLDQGDFSEGLPMLCDQTRDTTILRAHALIRRGQRDEGAALLRRVGPRKGDTNWALQWALAAVASPVDMEALLFRELETQTSARARGVVMSVMGESAERRGDPEATEWYRRAIDELESSKDDLGVVWCKARLARALARRRDDRAAELAHEAWAGARELPGVTLRGFAALACVETGLLTTDEVHPTLRRACGAELPELAHDARRAMRPEVCAPIVSVGPVSARVDGATLPLAAKGAPFRVLTYLCEKRAGGAASVDELFAAGWPDERASAQSMRKRVHTAIWTLRRAGLQRAIETVGRDRYVLRARVILPPEE